MDVVAEAGEGAKPWFKGKHSGRRRLHRGDQRVGTDVGTDVVEHAASAEFSLDPTHRPRFLVAGARSNLPLGVTSRHKPNVRRRVVEGEGRHRTLRVHTGVGRVGHRIGRVRLVGYPAIEMQCRRIREGSGWRCCMKILRRCCTKTLRAGGRLGPHFSGPSAGATLQR